MTTSVDDLVRRAEEVWRCAWQDPRAALTSARDLRGLAEARCDLRAVALSLRTEGRMLALLGPPVDAVSVLRRAAAACAEQGLITAAVDSHTGLFHIFRTTADLDGAAEQLERAAGLAALVDDPEPTAGVKVNASVLWLALGDPNRAAADAAAALGIARRHQLVRLELCAEGNLGAAHHLAGRFDAARCAHERALVLALRLGDRPLEQNARFNRAEALYQLGRYEEAAAEYQAAENLCVASGPVVQRARAALGLARAALAAGDHADALASFDRAIARGAAADAPAVLAQAYEGRSRLREATGDIGAALADLRVAWSFDATADARERAQSVQSTLIRHETRDAEARAAALAVHNAWLERQFADAEQRASFDPLTGALSRGRGTQVIRDGVAAARGRPLTLLALDVDDFKRVNDAHGHDVGDDVLREVVRRVSGVLRATDLIVRWGGEEFLILLDSGRCARAAVAAAERIRHAVGMTAVQVDGRNLEVTASIGVFHGLAPDGDWRQVVRNADEALYAAKRAGRNRVVLHDVGPGEAVELDPAAQADDALVLPPPAQRLPLAPPLIPSAPW